MSLIAEVSEQDVRLASRVAGLSELSSITLVEGSARLSPKLFQDAKHISSKDLEVDIHRKAGLVASGANSLRAIIRFRLLAKAKQKSKNGTLVTVSATFLAEYQLAEGFVPSDEESRAFVAANVVFNCWPYWREYVQSMVGRMNLPPLTLPFFRVRHKGRAKLPSALAKARPN